MGEWFLKARQGILKVLHTPGAPPHYEIDYVSLPTLQPISKWILSQHNFFAGQLSCRKIIVICRLTDLSCIFLIWYSAEGTNEVTVISKFPRVAGVWV